MRAVLPLALVLAPLTAQAVDLTPDASVSQSPSTTPSMTTWSGRSDAVAKYPAELADRPMAIGTGLGEAAFQGGVQINPALGFGEIPSLRYGITDNFEVNLLGVRYIVAEDGQYVPGLSIRAQLHDLAYQSNSTATYNYPVLRPGIFLDVRDRLPFHLAVNGEVGYVASIQAGNTANGVPIQDSQRFPAATAPMTLELQWSPLEKVSFALKGGYLDDVTTAPYEEITQSDGILQVAAIYNTSRFDVRVYFQSNWFENPAIGYVPEVGASVAVRL